jgi:hypothetical protein
MDENSQVIPIIRQWLSQEYTGSSTRVKQNPQNAGIDLYVDSFSELPVNTETTSMTFHVQVECKGSDAESDRALGQSLGYLVFADGVPTYLAFPYDYPDIGYVRNIVEKLDLPLGLLLVAEDGTVDKIRSARGEPKIYRLKDYDQKSTDQTKRQ